MPEAPTPRQITEADVIARVRAMAPTLAARRKESLALRRLPDETVAELVSAGLFKLLQPKRLGGLELPYGAQVAISAEVAKACGASGWLTSVVATHHWMLAKFDPRAQDDVWGKDPDAICCSAFGFAEMDCKPVDGGFRVSGRWLYSSGAQAAAWAMVGLPVEGPPGRRFALVARADFKVLDNWDSVALRGSGSSDITAADIFIPAYRTIGFDLIDQVPSPGAAANTSATYRLPTFHVFNLTGVGPALGTAMGALEAFTGGMKQRRNVLGSKIPEMQNIQLRTSEAGAEIGAAEVVARHHVATLQAAAEAGLPLNRGYLLQLQRDCAYIGRLCQNAVARLAEAQGAGGLNADNLVNMAQADLRGVSSHMTMGWDANAVPWGKFALGIEHKGLI